MSGQWKPGDVAMVRGTHGWRLARFGQTSWSREPCWWFLDSGTWVGPGSDAHAVLVIDVEDREQVEALAEAYISANAGVAVVPSMIADRLTNALRSLLPTPEPEEPRTLDARVIDRDGDVWALHAGRWHCLTAAGSAPLVWSDLLADCGPVEVQP